MAEENFILTRTGYEKLQRELDQLLTEESEEVAALLVDAREDESGEEATFYEAQVAKERLTERIAHLQRVLTHAEIIEDDPDPDKVSPGNRVTVWDEDEKEEVVFDLLGGEEIAHGRKGVSISSPVGRALLGHRVGDAIKADVPIGTVHYTIRKIEMIPDTD